MILAYWLGLCVIDEQIIAFLLKAWAAAGSAAVNNILFMIRVAMVISQLIQWKSMRANNFWENKIGKKLVVLFTVCLFAAASPSHSVSAMAGQPERMAEEKKITLGWLQSIRLLPETVRLTAKLDTGAKSSAIHAVDVIAYSKDGREYVDFSIPVELKSGVTNLRYSLPVIKQSKIKQHDRDLDIRYVVELDFCIAGGIYSAQFSLDDREQFNYPVLLGRDFLKNYFVVDPAQTFVAKYHCPDQ